MNHWTVGRRLASGITALVVMLTILTGFFLFNLARINGNVRTLANGTLTGMLSITHLQNLVSDYRLLSTRFLLSDSVRSMNEIEKQCIALHGQITTALTSHEHAAHSEDERTLVAAVRPALNAYEKISAEMRMKKRQLKPEEAANLLQTDVKDAYAKFAATVRAWTEYNGREAQNIARTAEDSVAGTRTATAILAGCSLIFAIGGGVYLNRNIGRTVRNVVGSIHDAAVRVATASNQIAGSSQSLATSASHQTASLEEASAALEEVASMTCRNADHALQAKELSQQTRTAADTGVAHMDEMKSAMDAITMSSAGISKIIKTIDEIAFQTNILALNAAVEAARAGEAGMGFAVVADEVRSLAQRSAQSAKETAEKIEEAVQKSEHGVRISTKVAQSLSEILAKTRQVDALIAEIATASQEQTQGITQVNSTVRKMDQVTQSNAASAHQIAGAAEEFHTQAELLTGSVANLTHLVGGSAENTEPLSETTVAGAIPASETTASKRRSHLAQVPVA